MRGGIKICRYARGVRSLHTVPKLTNVSRLSKEGIPRILSGKGFDIAWNQYQLSMVNRLNLAVAGTALESMFPFHILLKTARDRHQAHIFNLASGLHNNHLFMENIIPGATTEGPSSLFLEKVRESFDGKSWDVVKEEMLEQSLTGCLGQGWLFLVEREDKRLESMICHNNGTPYYFGRNQMLDLNSSVTLAEFTHWEDMKSVIRDSSKGKLKEKNVVKDWTIPLICINLGDVAYLNDYGILKRREYVKNCLDNLNWSVINNRLYSSTSSL
ncbi:hypothetical protein NCAS_0H00510 [Naumovozyma castellii]|uniref:Manganese/iron superoxide dismutase C-terminal domain-containing protein n=1 Tax=Naumovozyma castellii TaxID=27288 RepID=G0VIN5_NAUCA|nr:hypothetical protein NCAS_0H00510 [Naumovozyma castellii CBS 4309]CCC71361.1 hypothetical protein NCAS_0H00510 [Naumovozyma castellii CBS 4309]